ncbi:PAS domain S-box protein [Thermosynechococcaceae cyanobacterium Okahandja]
MVKQLSPRFFSQLSVSWQRLGLRWKLMVALAVTAIFPVAIVTESLIQLSTFNFERQLEEQLRSSLDDLDWEINNLSYEARIQALLIANALRAENGNLRLRDLMSPERLAGVLERVDVSEQPMNIMMITDAEGNVLAQRTMLLAPGENQLLSLQEQFSSPYRLTPHRTSSIAQLAPFQVGRDRQEMISGLVLLNRQEIKLLGLERQARIPLRPQPIHNLPLEEQPAPDGTYPIEQGDIGLFAFAAKPLYENNRLQGMVFTGVLLNNMPDLVDRTQQWSTVETVATIFAQDLRIATNVPYLDGQTRAIGTRVSRQVANTVLHEDREFRGKANIIGSSYATVYQPLHDFRQQLGLPHPPPIGIAFVGKSQAWISAMIVQKRLAAFVITLVTLVGAAGWAYISANAIVKPIQALASSTRRVREGNLDAHVRVESFDEVGDLAESFNSMLVQLQRSFRELEHKNRSLEQIRDELIEANEQFEAVLNAVPGTISWINAEGIYKGVNRKLAETLNLPPEAFIGRPLGFLREDGELAEFMQQFVNSPDLFASRVISVKRNGRVIFYLVALQKYMKGTHTVSVGIDITDRIRAEEALRIAEENYRSIFENALEGIFQSNTDGRFIRVNAAMASIFGFDSPGEMVASVRSIPDEVYVEEATREEVMNHFERGNTTGHFEFKAYRRDRQIIWVEVGMRVVRTPDGGIAYYEGLVQDITERKYREQAMQQQIEELKVEIDHEKRRQQVAEITETEYFQQLRQQATHLRKRSHRITT